MAGKAKFTVYQGSTFKHSFTVEGDGVPVDLTNCSIIMNVAPSTGPSLVYSTTSNHIVLTDALNGKFTLTITDEETTLFTWSSAKYNIHIEFTNGEVFRLLEGTLKLSKKV